MSPRSMSYEQLEERWQPLLRRFAAWSIPGMDYEDVMQELRIILYKCQQSFSSFKGAKFKTFLYRSLLNRVMQLSHKAGAGPASQRRQKVIPPQMISPLCSCSDSDDRVCSACKHMATVCDDTSAFDQFQGAPISSEARGVLRKVFAGDMSFEDQRNIPQRIKDELRRVIEEDSA